MPDSTTGVVTCFLRNRGEVLVLHRSAAVGSYSGDWGGVAGHAEGDPDALAREEIGEETGLLDAVTLVRAGEAFTLVDDTDDDRETRWRVHPYLFDCEHRGVETNDETTEYEWVPATELLRRETVPDLWKSYERVAPTLETVRDDTEHGSATISVRALEVLRDRAGVLAERDTGDEGGGGDERNEGDGQDERGERNEDGERTDGWDELADLAGDLREARPSMTAIENRINRVMHDASEERTPRAVERATRDGIERALDADGDAAANAAAKLAETVETVGNDAEPAGPRVLTLSRSGTVLETLRRAEPTEVVVTESRPACEGVGVAETLAEDTAVTLAVDAALAHLLAERRVDAVVVGADTVLPDGVVVNKVGTRLAALAAANEGIPFLVIAASDKVAADQRPWTEAGDPDAVYDGDATLSVANPVFDATPPGLVDAIMTENEVLDPGRVGAVAETHREWRGWAET